MLPPATIGPGEFFPVVGVGPHAEPWPTEAHFDPELLASGDRRNVLDKYRYWSVEAIVADLNTKRHGLQIAIENWQHDLNIGSIVRTANAFNVSGVHIVGKRDWNKRGAMVTDRYLTVFHHPTVEDLALWAKENNLPLIGIDNVPGSLRLEGAQLPQECLLLFGQEGAGMSDEGIAACSVMYAIDQYGSTRSMNASAAGAIAMYHWALQHLPR
ncbi:MAG: TrmH family RNA methyltransferase [Streptomycetaceae bacterium]|nr:MAG: TrmH family RNA methyltransferase [Streptomycetaceae bacterium]